MTLLSRWDGGERYPFVRQVMGGQTARMSGIGGATVALRLQKCWYEDAWARGAASTPGRAGIAVPSVVLLPWPLAPTGATALVVPLWPRFRRVEALRGVLLRFLAGALFVCVG